MKKFEAATWDHDAVVEAVCKELFKITPTKKAKQAKKNKTKVTHFVNADKIQKKKLTKLKGKSNKIKSKVSLGLQDIILQKENTKNTKILKSSKEIKQLKGSEINIKADVQPVSNSKQKTKTQKQINKLNKQKETQNSKTKLITINKKTNFENENKQKPTNKVIQNTDKARILKKHTKLHSNENSKLGQITLLKEKQKSLPLREKLMMQLKAARFRYLNEQMYLNTGREAEQFFKNDHESFKAYHEGFRQQVTKWPINPLNVIIKSIKKMPKTYVIADFGCGDAQLAATVEQKVHSFDLVAVTDSIIACDMAHVPLEDNNIDVAVFCLSLMGTNLQDYLQEANRVLKVGGVLKIAEIESRFDNVDNFIEGLKCFSFKKVWKDLSYNLFYFMDFKKEANIKNKKKLPTISLNPCFYKKR